MNNILFDINKNLARIAAALEESNKLVKEISGEKDQFKRKYITR